MAGRDIISRLKSGERFLLDGGLGSELQRRGLNLSKGVRSETVTGPWSATAMGDAPEVVRAVHEDYLRVGADIITTNSFWTNRPMLDMVGLGDSMAAYTKLSVELARDARDRFNPDAYVAGAMCPPRSGDVYEALAEQAKVLTAAGVDLLLLELVGSIEEAVASVDAASGTGLPVFLGSYVTSRATIQRGTHEDTGETIEALVDALQGRRVDAILPMCVPPDYIATTLPRLRAVYDGPIGAYANIGYKNTRREVAYPTTQFLEIQVEHTPGDYAACVHDWLDMGAQIIGGCCASTPEHIAALRPMM